MIDSSFYQNRGPYSLDQICHHLHTLGIAFELRSQTTDCPPLKGVAPLHRAGSEDVTFYHNPRYQEALHQTQAGLCVMNSLHETQAPSSLSLLTVAHPYRVYAVIADLFYNTAPHLQEGIHPTAYIHPSASLGAGCSIGPFAVVAEGVSLGDHCVIDAHAVLHPYVQVGDRTSIGSACVISHTHIGNDVYIKPGAKIGQRGFGFDMSEPHEDYLPIPQLGRVVIEDKVEVGANTTIDRGASGDTYIRRGAKIDNLCQIAHNVDIGEKSVIVAQCGISGSSKLGRQVIAGGQVGIAGHVTIGAGVKIAAQSGVIENVPESMKVMGYPAINQRDFFKHHLFLARQTGTKRPSRS